jgi:hypothetical protein
MRKVVRHVRSSPQRRKMWQKEVSAGHNEQKEPATASPTPVSVRKLDTNDEKVLMLILDVKTRWSSSHQMLRKSEWHLTRDFDMNSCRAGMAILWGHLQLRCEGRRAAYTRALKWRLNCPQVGHRLACGLPRRNNSNVGDKSADAFVYPCNFPRPPISSQKRAR